MRAIFDRLDDALIDGVFQPLADFVARCLSLDCSQQARVCINIAAVAWILSQAANVTAAVRSQLVGLQLFEAALLLLGLGSLMVLHALFQRAGGGGRGRANPLRAAMYSHRFCLLLALVLNIGRAAAGYGSLALLAVGVCTTAALYVAACSEPPPQQREADWGGRLALVRASIR